MSSPTLLAVPNVSEGRSAATIQAIAAAFLGRKAATADEAGPCPSEGQHVRLLDVHSDADHHRSVFTIAGGPGALAEAVLRGAQATVERVDVMSQPRGGERPTPGAAPGEHAQGDALGAAPGQHAPGDALGEAPGQHPHVGALDVAPIVYLEPGARGAACAEALVLADEIGRRLEVPVYLYGELTADESRPPRTRAELRRGGVAGLAARLAEGLLPDFGPPRMHPSAGATLVAARPPLVAFNLQLAAGATLQDAQRIAAAVREGGEHGLPGVRAIGVQLSGSVAQVSMNVERPFEVPLALVVAAVRRHAGLASAELVGLAPAAAMEGFPADLPVPGFDPARHVIENALGC